MVATTASCEADFRGRCSATPLRSFKDPPGIGCSVYACCAKGAMAPLGSMPVTCSPCTASASQIAGHQGEALPAVAHAFGGHEAPWSALLSQKALGRNALEGHANARPSTRHSSILQWGASPTWGLCNSSAAPALDPLAASLPVDGHRSPGWGRCQCPAQQACEPAHLRTIP